LWAWDDPKSNHVVFEETFGESEIQIDRDDRKQGKKKFAKVNPKKNGHSYFANTHVKDPYLVRCNNESNINLARKASRLR
jgi:hypothetical protein